MKRKTYIEKLGMEPSRKLTKKICKARVEHLRKGIAQRRWSGYLMEIAKYYVNHYAWIARHADSRRKTA